MGSQPPALGQDTNAARLGALSGRERELLGLLARGWSTRRIAQDWRVAESTVRSHVRNLLVKLDLHGELEAAASAWEHGVVVGDGVARASASASDDHSAQQGLAAGRPARPRH